MANFYEARHNNAGVNYGGVLIQGHGAIGGSRSVFVKLQGQGKNGLVFPPIGGLLKNPFKGFGKAYAGDLVEYKIDGSIYLLKTYEVAEVNGTTVKIVRDGYRHRPFVGDILMVAAAKLATAGTGVAVTAVVENTDNWEVTFAETVTASKGAILVEADKAGSGAKSVVQNPNAFIACDVDFVFDPAVDGTDFSGARYTLTPCLANEDTKLYVDKMSPLPASVKALNRSKVEGWFEL